jgi:hypothetical protein
VRGAAPLTRRTGWSRIDMRFANFSRSVSPGKHVLAGRLPGLHHINERPDRSSTSRPRKFPASAAIPQQTGFWELGVSALSHKLGYRVRGSTVLIVRGTRPAWLRPMGGALAILLTLRPRGKFSRWQRRLGSCAPSCRLLQALAE